MVLPLTVLCAVGVAAPAHAATAQWSCGADAVRASVAGLEPVNPITTTKAPCASQNVGAPAATNSVGLAPNLNARTAYAVTAANPAGARPLDQGVGSAAGVENLDLAPQGSPLKITAEAVDSFASARCVNGQPAYDGASNVVKLTINGQAITADGVLENVTNAITGSPLGAIVSVKLNQEIRDANGLTRQGVHIQLLNAIGAAPLADVVIAESRVSAASACDPNADGNTGGTGTGGGGGNGSGGPGDGQSGINGSGESSSAKVCATGSQLDPARGLCVIPASASNGQGTVVVGSAFTGPSGGKVVSLNAARAKYKSPCLSGSGPKFVIVGSSKKDNITGRNTADRILALGGNDEVSAGRGNDCVDGGTGGDNLSGAVGNDRVYGQAGNDHVNGGSGTDLLSAGAGNDTINTGFGTDTVIAGAGNDAINAATAGKPAKISCGAGRDTLRANRNEKRRNTSCERRYFLR